MKNTIKILFLFLCSLTLSAQAVESVQQEIDKKALIPAPQDITWKSGSFKCTPRTAFSLDAENPELISIVDYFNKKVTSALGYELPIKKKGRIELRLSDEASLGAEGYCLSVTSKRILLTATQPAGIFRGVQTLLQLMPKEIKNPEKQNDIEWTIPCCEVKDSPQFSWRGLMLDVSRHWFTKEEVLRMIDEMAEYKFNVFHWHLTDDQGWRIEIKSLPRLTEVGGWRAQRVGQWWHREPQQKGEKATYGGYYTQEDIKEVIAYAKERYIRVIPEIDVPGHSLAALVAYPELACFKAPESINVGNKFYGIEENTLCVGKEKTFDLLDKVFTEVAALFPDEYIHIGGDECFKGFWSKCPACQARMKQEDLRNVKELQSYVIRRLEKMLQGKGKKLIGWDEILEGGLAPDVTVMSWRGFAGGIKAAKAGHHVVMTPNTHCYLDLFQGEPSVEPDTYSMCRLKDSYAFKLIPEGVPSEVILGGQGNLWTESVPTFHHAEYMLWPRGWALAEVMWTGQDKTDWNKFVPRVEEHFKRADEARINYAKSVYNAIVTPQKRESELIITLSSEIEDMDIYYTFDNTDPDDFAHKYESPLSVPKDATWLRVVTYREGKPAGKVITLRIDELKKRVGLIK